MINHLNDAMVKDPELLERLDSQMRFARVATSDYAKSLRRYAEGHKAHAEAVIALADEWVRGSQDFRKMVGLLEAITTTQEQVAHLVDDMQSRILPGLSSITDLRETIYRCAARATVERMTHEKMDENNDEFTIMAALVGLDVSDLINEKPA